MRLPHRHPHCPGQCRLSSEELPEGNLAESCKTLRLWDTKTSQPVGAPMKGHESLVATYPSAPREAYRLRQLGQDDAALDAESGRLYIQIELDSSVLAVAWHGDSGGWRIRGTIQCSA